MLDGLFSAGSALKEEFVGSVALLAALPETTAGQEHNQPLPLQSRFHLDTPPLFGCDSRGPGTTNSRQALLLLEPGPHVAIIKHRLQHLALLDQRTYSVVFLSRWQGCEKPIATLLHLPFLLRALFSHFDS